MGVHLAWTKRRCPRIAKTYQVDIVLPNNVVFPNVQVTMGQFTGADILIGMDIITRGDFTVTNSGGQTKFSFRQPPQEHIDFVQQGRSTQASPNKQNRAERRRGQKQKRQGKKEPLGATKA